MDRLSILEVSTTPATMNELHAEISSLIQKGKRSFILSGNVHGINTARKHAWLRDFYNSADIVRIDGAGVVLAARVFGYSAPPRITWADWGLPLAAYCAKMGHSLYLLGGKPGAARKTAEIFREINPSIDIRGHHHGYFSKAGPENNAILDIINDAQPDILIVGFGMPLQEKWLLDNAPKINSKLFLTAGAAFEYLSGSMRRCPSWMGNAGFEWLFRLCMEPRRMAKRYLLGNFAFFIPLLVSRIRNGKIDMQRNTKDQISIAMQATRGINLR